jgi:hypothetical protein
VFSSSPSLAACALNQKQRPVNQEGSQGVSAKTLLTC